MGGKAGLDGMSHSDLKLLGFGRTIGKGERGVWNRGMSCGWKQ